jgi:hypothetical protein
MISFSKYFKLFTEAFKKSIRFKHLYDVPMFSVYINTTKFSNQDQVIKQLSDDKIKTILKESKDQINRIGFPSMHANIVFDDLRNTVNSNTGGLVAGGAHKRNKYMEVDYNAFMSNSKTATQIIVHEWAHLYMFNKSKGFKRAVKKFYNNLFQKGKDMWKLDDKTPTTFDHNDDVISPDLTDKLDELILNRIGIMFQNAYINRVDSLLNDSWIEDYGKEYDESDHYDDIESDIRGLLNTCIDEYNKATPNNPISKRDYASLIKTAIQTMTSKVSNPLWRKINNSIQKDMQDYENAMLEEPYDLGEYLFKNDTKYNKMFKFKNKSYYDKLDNLDDLGIGQSISSEIFNTLHQLNYRATKDRSKLDIDFARNLSGIEWNKTRTEIANLVKWVDDYGMSNDDEIWATGIEKFLKLEPEYRKEILKLMSVNDERELPNRRARKHLSNSKVP